MILNEDFFNDIEIKDEDLTAEQPKTSRELIEHKISESEMFLMIYIDLDQFHELYNIWHRIERIMKRVKYMFDIYNINISEPFLTYRDVSFKILKDKEFPDNYSLIQHGGCNLYFSKDELREYGLDKVIMNRELELFVFLDKKLPVFKTARSAYNFALNLDKCIWKDITNPKNECLYWYDLYNINDVHNSSGLIRSYADSNSYVNDIADMIYRSVLKLVPEELGIQLKKKRELLKLTYKLLKTQDVKNIIKLVEQ